MARLVVTVCDECGTQDGVLSFEVKQGDRRAKADLCKVHGASLEALLGNTTTAKPARRPRGGRSKVTTMEEIEKLKQ